MGTGRGRDSGRGPQGQKPRPQAPSRLDCERTRIPVGRAYATARPFVMAEASLYERDVWSAPAPWLAALPRNSHRLDVWCFEDRADARLRPRGLKSRDRIA